MSYLAPSEFVTKLVDAGESKIFMSTKDTLIRAYMAGAILALAAAFAVQINVQTGQPLAGAILFPVGFCILYLLGYDLLTGVFVLAPLPVWDKRPGCTWGGCHAQLGPGLHRQLRWRTDHCSDDGDLLHLWLFDRAERGGRQAGRDRRGANAGL